MSPLMPLSSQYLIGTCPLQHVSKNHKITLMTAGRLVKSIFIKAANSLAIWIEHSLNQELINCLTLQSMESIKALSLHLMLLIASMVAIHTWVLCHQTISLELIKILRAQCLQNNILSLPEKVRYIIILKHKACLWIRIISMAISLRLWTSQTVLITLTTNFNCLKLPIKDMKETWTIAKEDTKAVILWWNQIDLITHQVKTLYLTHTIIRLVFNL